MAIIKIDSDQNTIRVFVDNIQKYGYHQSYFTHQINANEYITVGIPNGGRIFEPLSNYRDGSDQPFADTQAFSTYIATLSTTATSGGGGTPSFEPQRAFSNGITINVGDVFANKVTLVTLPTLPSGTYEVSATYGWNTNTSGDDFEAQVLLDGNLLTQDHKQEPSDSSGDFAGTGSAQKLRSSMVFYPVALSGSHTIELQFRVDRNNRRASMWNAILKVDK